ncbi:MAG TPA: asparagine synthase C-terminal domain-containing protein [Nitrososphaera sp.]|nr:asparagine synthase C-terminal domain-containing protein [Nitrososphaera sp.]
MTSHCPELLKRLEDSVMRNRCDALLLSGGLDSSILAGIIRPRYAVTCSFGQDAPDTVYANEIAEKFCSAHVNVSISIEKMLDLVEQLVQIFRTFDPVEIRNSTVALAGIEQAKVDGYTEIMTGDGGDELFAGYNYLSRYFSDLPRLDSEIRRLWKVMHFSAHKIGEHVGVEVKKPYLDPEFMEYAKSLPVEVKVGEHEGRKWGKFILRTCYEPILGSRIAWRTKLAQEQGAATDRFESYINEKIDDLTFSNKITIAKNEGVSLRSKEHLHYYALYRSYFAAPREEFCALRCPSCHACMEVNSRFCRTCGAFPVTPISL